MRIDLVMTDYCLVHENGKAVPIDLDNVLDDPRGLTGTELNFIGIACALAQRGHDVRALSLWKDSRVVDGAKFDKLSEYTPRANVDLAVAYHDTSPLDWLQAKKKIASHHVYSAPVPNFDKPNIVNTAPSKATLAALQSRTYHTRWHELPNAVNLGTYVPWQPVTGRLTYHTSSTRGLHLLLRAMPEIRKLVPRAHLHVIGRHNWVPSWLASPDPEMSKPAAEIQAALAAPPPGVTFLGALGRDTVLRELSQSACFPFPCSVTIPCETFSVSVMEACFIGVPVVLSAVDALGSIYGGSVELAPAPPEFFQEDFVRRVVRMLQSPAQAQAVSQKERKLASQYTFESAAEKLENIATL